VRGQSTIEGEQAQSTIEGVDDNNNIELHGIKGNTIDNIDTIDFIGNTIETH